MAENNIFMRIILWSLYRTSRTVLQKKVIHDRSQKQKLNEIYLCIWMLLSSTIHLNKRNLINAVI